MKTKTLFPRIKNLYILIIGIVLGASIFIGANASRINIMDGLSIPTSGQVILPTWGERVHNFINMRKSDGTSLETPGNLSISGSIQIKGGFPGSGKFLKATDSAGNAIRAEIPNISGGNVVSISGASINSSGFLIFILSNGNILTGGYIGITAGAQGATGLLQPGTVEGVMPFWNGTQRVVSNQNIYNNGGNIGIGTNSPSAKLDVLGTIRSSSLAGNSGITGLNFTAGDRCVFSTINGVLKADRCSNLGSYLSDNLGNHQATENIKLRGNRLSNQGYDNGITLDNDGNVGISIPTDNKFRLRLSGPIGFKDTGAIFTVLDDGTAGNLGINISNPAKTLDVNGQMRVRGLSNTGNYLVYATADGDLNITAPGSLNTNNCSDTNSLLKSAGNRDSSCSSAYATNIGVGIGTANPLYRFQVDGSTFLNGHVSINGKIDTNAIFRVNVDQYNINKTVTIKKLTTIQPICAKLSCETTSTVQYPCNPSSPACEQQVLQISYNPYTTKTKSFQKFAASVLSNFFQGTHASNTNQSCYPIDENQTCAAGEQLVTWCGIPDCGGYNNSQGLSNQCCTLTNVGGGGGVGVGGGGGGGGGGGPTPDTSCGGSIVTNAISTAISYSEETNRHYSSIAGTCTFKCKSSYNRSNGQCVSTTPPNGNNGGLEALENFELTSACEMCNFGVSQLINTNSCARFESAEYAPGANPASNLTCININNGDTIGCPDNSNLEGGVKCFSKTIPGSLTDPNFDSYPEHKLCGSELTASQTEKVYNYLGTWNKPLKCRTPIKADGSVDIFEYTLTASDEKLPALTVNTIGGNVGIKKPNPLYALDVLGDINTDGFIKIGATATSCNKAADAGKMIYIDQCFCGCVGPHGSTQTGWITMGGLSHCSNICNEKLQLKLVDCGPKPANSMRNSVSQLLSYYSPIGTNRLTTNTYGRSTVNTGTSYNLVASSTSCRWRCNPGYTQNAGSCIPTSFNYQDNLYIGSDSSLATVAQDIDNIYNRGNNYAGGDTYIGDNTISDNTISYNTDRTNYAGYSIDGSNVTTLNSSFNPYLEIINTVQSSISTVQSTVNSMSSTINTIYTELFVGGTCTNGICSGGSSGRTATD